MRSTLVSLAVAGACAGALGLAHAQMGMGYGTTEGAASTPSSNEPNAGTSAATPAPTTPGTAGTSGADASTSGMSSGAPAAPMGGSGMAPEMTARSSPPVSARAPRADRN